MMRVCVRLSPALLLALAAFGQPAENTAKFEIADVHPSPHITQPVVRGPFFGGGRYELRFATMLDLIRTAYNVEPEKISGGPTWLEMDRFDVFATTAGNSSTEARRKMLQSLLADRFNLAIHNDSRPMPAYGLTVSKKGQLKEAEDSGESKCNFDVLNAPNAPPAPGTPIQLPVISYTCKSTSMETFAGGLLSMAGVAQYLNNQLVVDKTELQGKFDFNFRFTPKLPAGIATTGESIPLFDALEKQLGLKLDMATVPMPVIVVDKVDKKPTENSAAAMKSFPPLPTEFEVASLKPVAPDAQANGRPDIKNGRLFLPGFSLKTLIQVAWDLNTDEMLANAPKWLDDDKYDILAKAPSGVAMGDLTPSRNGIPVNIDALRPMLRSLITERFQLTSHMESRPVTAYTLSSNKPKLKKSDPSTRTRWQEGTLPDTKGGKNANPALGRLVTCQNVTMAQFAEMLPTIAPGYLRTDVLDATGMEGGYDFTFSFSPIGALQVNRSQGGGGGDSAGGAPGGGGGGGGASEASDPGSTMSLFDAMTKQLGLKLEMQKRPHQVLVIDKIERKPIEN